MEADVSMLVGRTDNIAKGCVESVPFCGQQCTALHDQELCLQKRACTSMPAPNCIERV